MRALLPAMLVSVFVLGAMNAHADEKADAKKHFDAGVVLMKAEDFAAAAAEFEASVSLHPTKNGLFNLANCYKALHKYPEALAALDSLEREYGKSLTGDLKSSAETMRKELESVICTIKVRVKKPGASVFVDGELVGKSPLPISATVGPGDHEVRVELPGAAPVVQTVKLVSGDTRELEFAIDGTDTIRTQAAAVGTPQPPFSGGAQEQPNLPTGAAQQVPISVSNCSTDRDCRRPRVCYQGECVSKTQRHTLETEGVNLIAPGWVFTSLGLASAIPSIILMKEYTPAGNAIMFAAVAPCIIIGLPLVIVGHTKRKRIKDGVPLLEVRNDHRMVMAPSLAVLDRGVAIGLGGRF